MASRRTKRKEGRELGARTLDESAGPQLALRGALAAVVHDYERAATDATASDFDIEASMRVWRVEEILRALTYAEATWEESTSQKFLVELTHAAQAFLKPRAAPAVLDGAIVAGGRVPMTRAAAVDDLHATLTLWLQTNNGRGEGHVRELATMLAKKILTDLLRATPGARELMTEMRLRAPVAPDDRQAAVNKLRADIERELVKREPLVEAGADASLWADLAGHDREVAKLNEQHADAITKRTAFYRTTERNADLAERIIRNALRFLGMDAAKAKHLFDYRTKRKRFGDEKPKVILSARRDQTQRGQVRQPSRPSSSNRSRQGGA